MQIIPLEYFWRLKMNNSLYLKLLLILTTHLTFITAQDCGNFKGTRPEISLLREARDDYISANDPRQKSVDPRGIRITNNAIASRQLNCTHNKPIRWVFHLDPLDTSMNVNIDFSERTEKEYSANLKFSYFSSELANTPDSKLFSCEPYAWEWNECERSFIQVVGATLQNDPVDEMHLHGSLKNLSRRLLQSSLEESKSTELKKWEECTAWLLVKAEKGNVLWYRWASALGAPVGNPEELKTNETTFLENALRLSTVMERGCAGVLGDDDPCADCIPVGDKDPQEWNITSEYTVNGVIFYAMFTDGAKVQKGHFSVPRGEDRKERRFYFDWEITPSVIFAEMMHIEAPDMVYTNTSFEVKCRMSIFHFSYGTVVATSEMEPTTLEGRYLFQEEWMPYGYREIRHLLKFNDIDSGNGTTVGCHAPLKRSPQWIRKLKSVTVEKAIPPTINGSSSNSSEVFIAEDGMMDIMLDCNVTGNPKPKFDWILPDKPKQEPNLLRDGDFSRLEFPKWEEAFEGTYICRAENRFGVTTRAVTFTRKAEDSNSKVVIIASSTLGAFMLLLGIAIGLLAWKIRKQRMNFEEETEKAIEEFRHGIMNEYSKDIDHANFSVLQLPYNEGFEMKKEHWIIEDKILGSGQFGIVRLGKVKVGERYIKLAVKTLKSAVEIDEFKSFLFELKIMAYLGQHKNIVSLVAACTEEINERDICIGVEFCDNGCLLNYLRKHRTSFRNMVTQDGKLISDASLIQSSAPEPVPGGAYANITSFTVSTYDLYRWSYHIASGMEYLATKKVLHGDLAARNVLLTQRKVAKVSDFGLSRVLMNSENYTKKTQTALPWKWMAIESLKERVFSANSDVWAYGITIWELFTLGQSPYPGIGWSPDFVVKLEKGLRMERPVHCTTSIYKVMQGCWDNVPHHRPKYAKIKGKLSKALRGLSVLANQNPTTTTTTAVKPKTELRISKGLLPMAIPKLVKSMLPIDIDDDIDINDEIGIYSNCNMQRSTENYYGNC